MKPKHLLESIKGATKLKMSPQLLYESKAGEEPGNGVSDQSSTLHTNQNFTLLQRTFL